MRSFILSFMLAGVTGGSALLAQQPPGDSGATRPMRQRVHQVVPMRMGGPDAGDHGRAYAPQRLIDRRDALGLTPEQVGRLEALAQEAAQARDAAASARETRRAQLDELWKADQPDAQALAGHMRAVMASQQEAQLAAVTAAARAKAVLTAEQRGRVAGWADAGRALRRAAMARPGRPRMRRDVPRRDGVQSPGMRRGLRPMR